MWLGQCLLAVDLYMSVLHAYPREPRKHSSQVLWLGRVQAIPETLENLVHHIREEVQQDKALM